LVKNILENIKDFNIEITDNLGRSSLRLAVENEHLEVVQALLSKSDSQKIRDCLLLAIYLGYTAIAEAILKHPKYKILNEKKFLNGDQDSFWQTPSSDDAQFSPDVTPIILAAQYNRTEIVQMLLINGDRISKPHDFNCKCTECLNKFKFDSLRHAQSRLNAYKGLASESYISLASIDPILTSFELSRELGILAEKEKYFKHEYLQLKSALSIYSVKLLNNVRGRDELEIVLDKAGKEKEEKYSKLARLDLALKYEEKPVDFLLIIKIFKIVEHIIKKSFKHSSL
jgi:transient receptor potential cation channel subfamily C protein 6